MHKEFIHFAQIPAFLQFSEKDFDIFCFSKNSIFFIFKKILVPFCRISWFYSEHYILLAAEKDPPRKREGCERRNAFSLPTFSQKMFCDVFSCRFSASYTLIREGNCQKQHKNTHFDTLMVLLFIGAKYSLCFR